MTEQGDVSERSEGTDKHSIVITPPTEEDS